MEPITLAISAYHILLPFLTKTGEGAATKIGEDIWSLVKSAFTGKRSEDDLMQLALTDKGQFESELDEVINSDKSFHDTLKAEVEKAKSGLGVSNQQINNNAPITKQVNFGGDNHGQLSF